MKRTESKSSRLYEQLKNEILAGRYTKSCAFPSEVALSRRFCVSRSLMANVVRDRCHLQMKQIFISNNHS